MFYFYVAASTKEIEEFALFCPIAGCVDYIIWKRNYEIGNRKAACFVAIIQSANLNGTN